MFLVTFEGNMSKGQERSPFFLLQPRFSLLPEGRILLHGRRSEPPPLSKTSSSDAHSGSGGCGSISMSAKTVCKCILVCNIHYGRIFRCHFRCQKHGAESKGKGLESLQGLSGGTGAKSKQFRRQAMKFSSKEGIIVFFFYCKGPLSGKNFTLFGFSEP